MRGAYVEDVADGKDNDGDQDDGDRLLHQDDGNLVPSVYASATMVRMVENKMIEQEY